MAFTFVATMDEVLRHALLPEPMPGLADRAQPEAGSPDGKLIGTAEAPRTVDAPR
jgi:hypothetical protein